MNLPGLAHLGESSAVWYSLAKASSYSRTSAMEKEYVRHNEQSFVNTFTNHNWQAKETDRRQLCI